MDIRELRTGNFVKYEACTYEVMAVNILGSEKLNVKAVNHDWGVELCGINEVTPLEITTDFLKSTHV